MTEDTRLTSLLKKARNIRQYVFSGRTLSSHWYLVGEASALRSGSDLFYVIERGK